MKAFVLKSFVKSLGNDYQDYYFNDGYVNTIRVDQIEKVLDLSYDEFNELREAINFFNNKNKDSEYKLILITVVEDEELNNLLSDFKSYRKKEDARIKAAAEAAKLKAESDKMKREAAAKKRLVKKMVKELGINELDVEKLLSNKK